MRPRTAGAWSLPAASLAVVLGGLLAGCGLKGPLFLPEKSGDVTIRPAPTPAGAPASGAPAPAPETPGAQAPSSGAPPAVPETTQAPAAGLPESNPSGTGHP